MGDRAFSGFPKFCILIFEIPQILDLFFEIPQILDLFFQFFGVPQNQQHAASRARENLGQTSWYYKLYVMG